MLKIQPRDTQVATSAMRLTMSASVEVVCRRMLLPLLASFYAIFLIGILGSTEGALAQKTERIVLAHYMVCCPFHGHKTTEDQFANEMRTAVAAGVDGFTLNFGGWSKEPIYPAIVSRMYAAAGRVPEFRLVLSLDFSGLTLEEGIDAVRQYARHKSNLSQGDRPVVTTYGGTPHVGRDLRRRLAELGIEIVYVPYYDYPHYRTSSLLPPVERDISIGEIVMAENRDLDGQFYFGAAQDGAVLAEVIRVLTNRLRKNGKIALMGVSPHYRGLGSNYRIFEARGFSGMEAQWRAAIAAGASWVELVTWNDWGEASYVAPFGARPVVSLWNGAWGSLMRHDGFLEASRYFIDWFKQGVPPKIEEDIIYYFYRPHLKNAEGLITISPETRGRPSGSDRLIDALFLNIRLQEAANLVVTTDSQIYKFHIESGISNQEIPLSLGSISISLQRGDNVIASKKLELPVVADGKIGNFNFFSGILRK